LSGSVRGESGRDLHGNFAPRDDSPSTNSVTM
jgi:hypothetical protein